MLNHRRCDLLLSPIRVKCVELRNRIVMPAMHLPQPSGRRPSLDLTAFYEERARGGVALIMIGGCGIDMCGSGPYMLGIDSDEFRSDYERLNGAIKAHGAASGIQLFHAGRYARSADTGEKPVAPSPVRSRLTGETPRELTQPEIEEIVRSFAAAAGRVRAWGFDVVEVIASAGYLVSQFLSPLTNHRTDAYGGSLEARARFMVEVIGAVRRAAGDETPIMLRLSGSDFVEGGNTLKDTVRIARIAAQAGVDVLNVTGGWHETRVPQISGFVPPKGFSYLARAIREAVADLGVLVAASNRINDPLVAEELLRGGECDLVSMGRALIADPALPRKATTGETLIPCIACNQSCFDHLFDHQPAHCLVNPRAGRELAAVAGAAPRRKCVAVVGGGPAGCTAAITAAERGHRVVLFETDALGGKARMCARSYGKHEWRRLPEYYEARVAELGIELRSGRDAAVDEILGVSPDAVVLATGSIPATPPIPGADLPLVTTAEAVLSGRTQTGRNVVVVGGAAVGCEVALELAIEGAATPDEIYFLLVNGAEDYESLRCLAFRGTNSVTMIEMLSTMGQGIGRSTKWTYMEELKRRGVRMLTNTKAVVIEPDGVVIETRGETQKLPADTVVMATGYVPDSGLAAALAGKVPELHVIGDSFKVGDAEAAILHGFEIGSRL
ncbi:MAG: FAD-dependent oxidoreductase [Acidobacteriota bacterium]